DGIFLLPLKMFSPALLNSSSSETSFFRDVFRELDDGIREFISSGSTLRAPQFLGVWFAILGMVVRNCCDSAVPDGSQFMRSRSDLASPVFPISSQDGMTISCGAVDDFLPFGLICPVLGGGQKMPLYPAGAGIGNRVFGSKRM